MNMAIQLKLAASPCLDHNHVATMHAGNDIFFRLSFDQSNLSLIQTQSISLSQACLIAKHEICLLLRRRKKRRLPSAQLLALFFFFHDTFKAVKKGTSKREHFTSLLLLLPSKLINCTCVCKVKNKLQILPQTPDSRVLFLPTYTTVKVRKSYDTCSKRLIRWRDRVTVLTHPQSFEKTKFEPKIQLISI